MKRWLRWFTDLFLPPVAHRVSPEARQRAQADREDALRGTLLCRELPEATEERTRQQSDGG